MEGSRRTWLDPDKEENFFKKYFWLSGRIGRGTFGIRMLFLLLFLLVSVISFLKIWGFPGWHWLPLSIPSQIYIPLLIFILCWLWSAFTLVGRRLHDMAHTSGASLLALFLIVIIAVGGAIFRSYSSLWFAMASFSIASKYLFLWPGDRENNEYGEPRRFRLVDDETSWQQLKKEFFSTKGRLGRKWFFWIALFFVDPYQVNTLDIEQKGWFFHFVIFANFTIIMLNLTVVSIAICRRLQDIGRSFYWAILPVFMKLISCFGGVLGIGWEITSKIYMAWVVIILILALIPGQEGSNEHGRNPVEADLLPGEVAD